MKLIVLLILKIQMVTSSMFSDQQSLEKVTFEEQVIDYGKTAVAFLESDSLLVYVANADMSFVLKNESLATLDDIQQRSDSMSVSINNNTLFKQP